jgi:membrane-associated protein
MPWVRFASADAIAAAVWAAYAGMLGYIGGKQFENAPWKGLIVALTLAFAVTAGVELVRHIIKKRKTAR